MVYHIANYYHNIYDKLKIAVAPRTGVLPHAHYLIEVFPLASFLGPTQLPIAFILGRQLQALELRLTIACFNLVFESFVVTSTVNSTSTILILSLYPVNHL